MKWLVATVCVIGFASCVTSAKPQQASKASADSSLRCLKVMNLFPEITVRGVVADYDTNYAYIYWYGNQVMYMMTHTHYHLSPVELARYPKTKFYHRLVVTKGQAHGSYYNEWLSFYNKKVLADSLLKEDWVGTTRIEMDTFKNEINRLSSAYLPNSDTLLEVYGYKVRADSNIYSTLNLYFVPYRPGLPYSIDTVMEKAKNMTLCKVLIFTHVGYMIKGKFRVLEFKSHTELQEVPVTNREELMPYFIRNQKGKYSVQIQDIEY